MIQICLFLCSVFLVSSVISTPSVGQCTRLVPLSVASALNSTCLDVVDYLFYLPTNVSIVYLDQLARNRLSDASLSSLPTICQLSLKKAVCSSVYLKCHPDYVEGDLKTYNYRIFSDVNKTFALPFQRPCVSVCQNANRKCLGLLNLQGKALNCTSLTDYSRGAFGVFYGVSSYKFPHTYDLAPSSTSCNSMTAVGSVASTSEVYLKASSNGACSGIVNDLYVPPGNLISPNLAPMQGPYIVQSIIESQLASSFNQLPPWLSKSCHLALRKYFCGSYMLAPQPQRFGDVLVANNFSETTIQGIKFQLGVAGVNVSAYLKHTFYLPSYPSRQVCVDYRDSCGLFINASGLASLIPKCDSVVRGIVQYPTTTQTISALPLSATLVVKFQTQPNAMRSANDSNYSTMCPEGYVIPDTPSNPRNIYVPGSGCAIACRAPIYTPAEFKILDAIVVIGPCLSVALLLVLLISWLAFKPKDLLLAAFTTSAGINSLWFVVMTIFKNSFSSTASVDLCLNNAIALAQVDGPSMCVAQAVIGHSTTLFCACVFLLLSLKYAKMQFASDALCLLLSALLIAGFVIVTGIYGAYGYDVGLPYCLYHSDGPFPVQVACFYLPMLAIVVTGTTILQLKTYRDILQRTYKKRNNGTEGESQEPDKTVKNKNLGIALLIFLWIYSIFWCSVFILKLLEYLQHQALVLSFIDWTGCIFKNFLDAKQPDAWRAVCGNTPKFRLSFSFVCWGVLWTSCHSLLVVAIYIPEIWLGGLCRSAGQRVGFEVSSDKSDVVEDVHLGTAVHVRNMEGGMDRQSYPNYDENEKNKSGGTWPQLCEPQAGSPEHKL